MKKSFSLLSLSLLTLLMSGCTLTPSHFDGEDLLDTGYKSEMQDPVVPPVKELSDVPPKKAVSAPKELAPAPIVKTETKTTIVTKVETPASKAETTSVPIVAETKETCKATEVLPPPAPGAPIKEKREILQKDDRVKVTVFREKDLTGEYQLNEKGMIKFPLLGYVSASGLTAHQLQEKLTAELSKGYLVKPEVSVEFLPDCKGK